MKYSTVVLALAVGTAVTAQSPSKLPNVGWAGYGYNVFYGNPHASNTFDPGFGQVSIFDLTYADQQTTPDGKWYIPDNVGIPGSATSCSAQGTSDVIQYTSDYQSSLSVDAKVDLSGYGASFSASTDYKQVDKSTTTSKDVYVSTYATCQTYLVDVNAFVHPVYSNVFVQRGSLLPTTFDPSNASMFWEFFDLVGTHFPTQMVFGSRWGYNFQSSQDQWTTLQTMSLDVNVAASYAGAIKAGVSVNTSYEKSMAMNFSQNTETSSQYSLGLPPPSDGNSNSWEQAALSSTLMEPLTYTLVELYNLFTPDYITNAALNARATAVQNALQQYCTLHLLPSNKLSSCDAPPTPPPPPPPSGHGALACGKNNGQDDCYHNWATVFDGTSDIQAQEIVLDMCPSCHIETTIEQGTCFAMSTCSQKSAWGWAQAGDQGSANTASLNECKSYCDGNDCTLQTYGCATPPPTDIKWGAIACDSGCNNYKGTPSTGFADRIEAHHVAMEEIGGSAQVAIDFNQCGALTKGDGGWSASSGDTPQDASNNAMNICNSHYGGCNIAMYSCIDPTSSKSNVKVGVIRSHGGSSHTMKA